MGRRGGDTCGDCRLAPMPRISDDVLAQQDALLALRRDLHHHPELAFAETRTAARVAALPRGRGPGRAHGPRRAPACWPRARGGARPHRAAARGHGRAAHPGAERRPLRLARAGRDARLRPRRPRGDGRGGGARPRRPARWPATVRVLFQPAEEGEGGAQAVVADGVLDGVDVVLGVHLWNELPVGTLGVKAGPLMAAVDRLQDRGARARAATAASPTAPPIPVVAAAHVVTALQTVVAREVSPVQAAVVTIGSIHGGEAFNVIPDEVTLTGTIRTFDAELRRSMPERITRIASGVAAGAALPGRGRGAARQPGGGQRPGGGRDRAPRGRARGGRGAAWSSPSPPWAARTWRSTSSASPAASCSWARPTRRAAWTSRTTARASTSTRTRSPSAASSWCRRRRKRSRQAARAQTTISRPRGAQRRPLHARPRRSRGRCPGLRARRSCRRGETVTGGSTRSSSK